MLTIRGDKTRFCDGVSRREFLRIGALTVGGLSLTDVLAAEARAGTRSSHKSVIMIYLPGGLGHQDSLDLKPEAPDDFRGEFKPIKTNVPGIEVCELMPKLAKMMDKFTVIRSLVGARDEHANPLCLSGYPMGEARANQPCFGAAVNKIWGPVDRTIPAYVDLIPNTQHKPYCITPATGFLGRAYGAVRPADQQGMGDMVLNGVSLTRLGDRKRLLTAVDRFRGMVDRSEEVQASDYITQKAFDILTSRKFVDALDVSKEDAKIRERYGKGQDSVVGDAGPARNETFLAARRLIEAGARCVTLAYGFWDFHGGNFANMKKYLPMLDTAITALVQDLHDRGLDKDVSVIMWGDFGRTPKINKDAGRDHWPSVASCLMAGGGMRAGQVIGSTTKDGGYADERPVHYRDVLATLHHNMGFDTRRDLVMDSLDRPQYLLPGHEPLPELVG
jgi:hypothetical protein